MQTPKNWIINLCVTVLFVCILPETVWALAESTNAGGTNAQAVHSLGITGAGINVGLISQDNTRITHESFKDDLDVSHAFAYDFSGDGILSSNHDTWVAGVTASRGGAVFPDDIGVAPGVDIHSARVVDDSFNITTNWIEDALDELILNQNCKVIMTGIALSGITPDGQSTWAKIYDYYAYQYNVVFANPAGNSITSVDIFGDTYNGITTGGLNVSPGDIYDYVGTLSGEGPTPDGRRKPEVTAPSQNQTIPSGSSDTSWITWTSGGGETSFSTPHTAGVAALLLEHANNTPEQDDDKNVVIKAVMVNSTFPNINDRSNIPTTGLVWHNQKGYGRLDALKAYQILNSPKVTKETTINQPKGWAYENMTRNYQQDNYIITGTRNQRLLLTVTWNRKINKSSSTYSAETDFNIDISVKAPSSSVIFSETDVFNNLEKADLMLEENGPYEISIENKTTANKDYGFAFELIDPLTGDFEPIDYSVDINDLAMLAQTWGQTGTGMQSDLYQDDVIDFLDFAVFADHWLETNPAYYIP